MSTNDSPSILSHFQLTGDQHAAVTGREAAISVTAGAGSGKTRTLVGRYLALLEAGRPLRSLVAITFTDKAAREMRNRIREITTQWLARAESAGNRQQWQEVFSALDAARISTIHGLCATILRAHPAEAALDPAFGLLDEGQSAVWQARAVEAGLVWAAADPEVGHLFDLFQEGQLRRLTAALLAQRLDAAQILTDLSADLPAHWAAALDAWLVTHFSAPAWQESLATLNQVQATTEDDKLEIARQSVLAYWAEIRQAQADRAWDDLFAALPALRGAISTGGQKGNWVADDLTAARAAMATLRAHFDEVISRLVDKKKPLRWSLDQQVAAVLPLVRRLFEQTQAIYQGYKNEAHALDFDDLEQMAAHLLRANPAVRRRWQREISAILLVDEFQDTNRRQREIVYALAGFEGNASRGGLERFAWKAGRMDEASAPSSSQPSRQFPNLQSPNLQSPNLQSLPSSLFIVGDGKQSIYRFRGADVTVFRQVQADIRTAGGKLIDFDLTFRAHRPLVELTNALLAPLMPAEDDPARPYDVPFAPLTAYRTEPKTARPPYLEFHLGLGEDKAAGRLTAATALAERLHTLRAEGQIEWQDVALLFRASTAFGVYEDALEQAGIPFVTVAGRGFYDRPEVRDLLNALAAIADPTDDLAMAGLLRSPAIGLSDEALHRLRWTAEQQRRSFWPALQNLAAVEGLSGADRQQAEFARQLIAALHAQVGRVPVAHLLKTLLDETYYRAALRLAPGGERLRRNVDKLLADAHRSELISVSEFLEYLAALGDVGARESEAPTEAGGAVQLMTIHKAKGLEFPLVVLADAGYSGSVRAAPFHLDETLGLLLPLSDGEALPAAFRLAAQREAEQEAAEERRLLYVAATRAMEKFIVSGEAKLSTAKTSPGKLLLSGWLAQLAEVTGFSDTQLSAPPAAPHVLALEWGEGAAACTLYPQLSPSVARLASEINQLPTGQPAALPDLLTPVSVPLPVDLDQKLRERESDPPPRVWRVAPPSQYEVPAWVVGSLTHLALRHWRFPNDDPAVESESGFADFLRPFALEAGLTDEASIETALSRVSRLLSRLQSHPLYRRLAAAKRHHELPYSLMLDGQTHNGLIDLLFRDSPETAWTIAEFKTDRLPADIDLRRHAQEKGYLRQVEVYQQAVAQQLGTTPPVLLVFLNVGQTVQILDHETRES